MCLVLFLLLPSLMDGHAVYWRNGNEKIIEMINLGLSSFCVY